MKLFRMLAAVSGLVAVTSVDVVDGGPA